MRFLNIFLIMILAAACGKSTAPGKGPQKEAQAPCTTESGIAVPCTPDGQGTDFLEPVINVPVSITDSSITFLETKSESQKGRLISCEAEVKNGEVYSYSLSGDSLQITTSDGERITMARDNGEGINGKWVWSGYNEDGAYLIKQITIVNSSRAILRNKCEK